VKREGRGGADFRADLKGSCVWRNDDGRFRDGNWREHENARSRTLSCVCCKNLGANVDYLVVVVAIERHPHAHFGAETTEPEQSACAFGIKHPPINVPLRLFLWDKCLRHSSRSLHCANGEDAENHHVIGAPDLNESFLAVKVPTHVWS
jgi:hypothetical protein